MNVLINDNLQIKNTPMLTTFGVFFRYDIQLTFSRIIL